MIKKLTLVLFILLCLCGCKDGKVINDSAKEKYNDMVVLLNDHDNFAEASEFFDVSYDISKISEGYRFYIIIDNAKTAMYNVTAIAIEKGVDYSGNMAANIGIFEDHDYSLIPNQYNVEKGFVKGINISGITDKPAPVLYLLVEWSNKSMSITYREYIKIVMNRGTINE